MPEQISAWFAGKVPFSVKLPNYQEISGQEKLYKLEGGRLVGYKKDYAAYVAYQMQNQQISLVVTSDSVARPSGRGRDRLQGHHVSLRLDRRVESHHVVGPGADIRAGVRPRRARAAILHSLPSGHERPGLHREPQTLIDPPRLGLECLSYHPYFFENKQTP